MEHMAFQYENEIWAAAQRAFDRLPFDLQCSIDREAERCAEYVLAVLSSVVLPENGEDDRHKIAKAAAYQSLADAVGQLAKFHAYGSLERKRMAFDAGIPITER